MKSNKTDVDCGVTAGSSACAFMIVYMDITDPSWMEQYFKDVPALLAEHGGVQIAGGRQIVRVEGSIPIPDRIAIFRFSSLAAAEDFMKDERYQNHRANRRQGSSSQILILESAPPTGALV